MEKQYRHDMSGESDNAIFPAGWREFKIISCKDVIFKSGNEGFEFVFMDLETGQDFPIVRAVAVPKKRWFLKQILVACGVPAGLDGVYEWDIADVLNKQITGKVENYNEKWINRDGIEQITEKSKITVIKKSDNPVIVEKKKEEIPF